VAKSESGGIGADMIHSSIRALCRTEDARHVRRFYRRQQRPRLWAQITIAFVVIITAELVIGAWVLRDAVPEVVRVERSVVGR
jgi:hypothetical protein